MKQILASMFRWLIPCSLENAVIPVSPQGPVTGPSVRELALWLLLAPVVTTL